MSVNMEKLYNLEKVKTLQFLSHQVFHYVTNTEFYSNRHKLSEGFKTLQSKRYEDSSKAKSLIFSCIYLCEKITS